MLTLDTFSSKDGGNKPIDSSNPAVRQRRKWMNGLVERYGEHFEIFPSPSKIKRRRFLRQNYDDDELLKASTSDNNASLSPSESNELLDEDMSGYSLEVQEWLREWASIPSITCKISIGRTNSLWIFRKSATQRYAAFVTITKVHQTIDSSTAMDLAVRLLFTEVRTERKNISLVLVLILHTGCYGLEHVPGPNEEWYCERCKVENDEPKESVASISDVDFMGKIIM